MAPVVVPMTLLAVARGRIAGKPWVNTFGIRSGPNGGGGGYFIDQAGADAIGAAVRGLYDRIKGGLSTQWVLDAVSIADLQSVNAQSWDATITEVQGTNTVDPMPSHIAIVASHRTGFRGKSYRGRTYLAGFTESDNVSPGIVSPGLRVSIAATFATFRADLGNIAGGGLNQAVVSRKLATSTVVTDTVVDALWDRQDRRKQ